MSIVRRGRFRRVSLILAGLAVIWTFVVPPIAPYLEKLPDADPVFGVSLDRNGKDAFYIRGVPFESYFAELPNANRYDLLRYRFAVWRFPSVESCISPKAIDADRADVQKLNWWKIGNMKDAEVCVFRIFDALSSQEKSVRWLEAQGMDVEIYSLSPSERVLISKEFTGLTRIYSIRPAEPGGFPFRSLRLWAGAFLSRGFIIEVIFGADGKPRHVRTGHTFL